jgi:hypothetical protein
MARALGDDGHEGDGVERSVREDARHESLRAFDNNGEHHTQQGQASELDRLAVRESEETRAQHGRDGGARSLHALRDSCVERAKEHTSKEDLLHDGRTYGRHERQEHERGTRGAAEEVVDGFVEVL